MKALTTHMLGRQLENMKDGLFQKGQLSMFWMSGDCWLAGLCGLSLRTTTRGCWAVAKHLEAAETGWRGSLCSRCRSVSQQGPVPVSLAVNRV